MAIRTVRDEMYIGIKESQVRRMMENALFAAGLEDSFALVLFGGTCETSDILHIMTLFLFCSQCCTASWIWNGPSLKWT
jgi:hypothetical protein